MVYLACQIQLQILSRATLLAANVRQAQFERILSIPMLAPGEVRQVKFKRCMMTEAHQGMANSPDRLFAGLVEPPAPFQNTRDTGIRIDSNKYTWFEYIRRVTNLASVRHIYIILHLSLVNFTHMFELRIAL